MIRIKEKKLCTIGGISLSAFIGGPLGPFYLMSKNYSSMNQTPQAILSLCYGLFFTFITFGLLILLDNNTFSYIPALTTVHNNMLSHHSYFIMRASFAGVIGIFASMLQATSLNTELQSGVKKTSILEIIGISIVSLMISILLYKVLIQISQSAFVEHYLELTHQLWIAIQAIHQHGQ